MIIVGRHAQKRVNYGHARTCLSHYDTKQYKTEANKNKQKQKQDKKQMIEGGRVG